MYVDSLTLILDLVVGFITYWLILVCGLLMICYCCVCLPAILIVCCTFALVGVSFGWVFGVVDLVGWCAGCFLCLCLLLFTWCFVFCLICC